MPSDPAVSDDRRPAVAVAVVSWNTRELLAACLRSLRPDADAGLAEVWVVDNASSDGSAELVRREFPWARLVACEENLGFGRAVNLVAQETRTPWIAPANADVELTPGALARLLETGAARPRAGIVAPRLVLHDGSTQQSVHPFPTLPLTLVFNAGLHLLSRRLADRLLLEHHWDPERPRDVDWAIAAFQLVRREAFEQAGGFDEAHWMYAEDLDLAWRLARLGWTTRYEPAAVVRHAASAAATQAFEEEVVDRWMAATYAWMARRRGMLRTWCYAAVNWLGATGRLALTRPRERRDPRRWAPVAQEWRTWRRAHRAGLRSRRELLRAVAPPGRMGACD